MIRCQPQNSPKRKIVFIASLLSFSVIPGWASYAPARAAIRMLADTLREECLLYDIDVHCIFPANFTSPGFEVEEITKPEITRALEGTAGIESVEAVSKMIVNRLERGHRHITYNFVGSMVKVRPIACRSDQNMMTGMTERDNPIYDILTGFIGSIAWPFVRGSWRKMIRKYKAEHAGRELPSWP